MVYWNYKFFIKWFVIFNIVKIWKYNILFSFFLRSVINLLFSIKVQIFFECFNIEGFGEYIYFSTKEKLLS